MSAPPAADATPDRLISTLEAEADPQDAVILAGYFRTEPGGYGEGDQFWGIKLSRLRVLLKPYRGLEFVADEWLPLLHSPVHEQRLACLVFMAERARRGPAAEQQLIYETYLDQTEHVNNWDLVDVSCGPVVGGYLLDRDRKPLYRLARSSWLWDRRIAIVSTMAFLRAGDPADTYRLAERLRHDDHDLIHKATGWLLREAGKRTGREQLLEFLDAYAAELPRTMLRYAIEHLDAESRQHYLGLRRLAR